MSKKLTQALSNQNNHSLISLAVAPAKVIRGCQILNEAIDCIASLGGRPLIVSGDTTLHAPSDTTLRSKSDRTWKAPQSHLEPLFCAPQLKVERAFYNPDCSEASLKALQKVASEHSADVIIGVGGGKALDTAKLLAHQLKLPVVTIPTSASTCAAWTALSNVYSDQGAFLYDVTLSNCPNLLVLDYDLIQTAPQSTLVAGIGDAIAKWYEASVSSGQSEQTLIISAVQQARVLRDILFQKSAAALKAPGSPVWREVVDATVLLAGIVGGIGGAQCRTVAAHAVHNGLTHVCTGSIHGEKVSYGILVQLRLEEMVQGNQLAASARQQLLKFYSEIGLPQKLEDLGLSNITLGELQEAVAIALSPNSDIHRLPFQVVSEQLIAAMVSTTAPVEGRTHSGIISSAVEEEIS